jgi:hypothetical protein
MNMQQLQENARNLNKEIENVEDHIKYLERQLSRNIQNFEQGTDAEYRARFGDKILERIKEEHDEEYKKAIEIKRDLFNHLRRINEAITDEEREQKKQHKKYINKLNHINIF